MINIFYFFNTNKPSYIGFPSFKKLLIFCIAIISFLTSCNKTNSFASSPEDYNKYLNTKNVVKEQLEKRIQILNQIITKDSVEIVEIREIAGNYSALFEATGNIEYLKKAETALLKAFAYGGLRVDRILLDLARNYISQHRFKEAEIAANKAHEMNPNADAKLVLFDTCMELGKIDAAESYLMDKKVANPNDFNFLIRMAKWNDHHGNMDAVLEHMEKASRIATNTKNLNLMKWSYTNLATYYGHAGKIEASYNYFLKSLDIDNSNAFAKKGIAWIVYSYEKNADEALRIVNTITKNYKSPDYFLFKADLSEFKNDNAGHKKQLAIYEDLASNPMYGNMYNTYNALYLADNKKQYDDALQILEKEISHRPIPTIYGLKAYVLNLKGLKKEALDIANEYVINKTHEPMAHYYVSEIFRANDLVEQEKSIKKELLESSFELGPLLSQKINARLN